MPTFLAPAANQQLNRSVLLKQLIRNPINRVPDSLIINQIHCALGIASLAAWP